MMTTVAIAAEEAPRALAPIPLARHILGDISHTAIYELFKQDHLVKVNIGRRSFVTMESIAQYVERLKSAAEQDPTRGIRFGRLQGAGTAAEQDPTRGVRFGRLQGAAAP
jgi:hypothetical protein